MLIEHLCNAMILLKMIMEVLPKEQSGALAEDRSCYLSPAPLLSAIGSAQRYNLVLGPRIQPAFDYRYDQIVWQRFDLLLFDIRITRSEQMFQCLVADLFHFFEKLFNVFSGSKAGRAIGLKLYDYFVSTLPYL